MACRAKASGQWGDDVSQEIQVAGFWPGLYAPQREADDKSLEAVFESLGPACVCRLVSVPQPLGLAPRDRRAAQRWLSRRVWAQRHRDLTIILALVAVGLAAAFFLLTLYPLV